MSSENDDDIGAYVLGLLEGADRARFEARMAGDPVLARRVEQLEQHFCALDDTATAEAVPPALWAAIARRLEGTPQETPANADAVPSAPARRRPAILRAALMAAGIVVALGIGFMGGVLMQPAPPAPLVIAVLMTEDMQPGAIIEAFGDDSVRIVPLEQLVAPQGRVLEVWTLPSAETGPVSLGTFERATELRLSGPGLPPPRADQLYEITVEPEGGSPTGRPTGPILLMGYARPPV